MIGVSSEKCKVLTLHKSDEKNDFFIFVLIRSSVLLKGFKSATITKEESYRL